MDTSKLKKGEYYGYYDENGKWITGQNGPNPMSPTDQRLVDDWDHNYRKLFTKQWFKAVGKDLLFVFGIKGNNC